MRNKLIYIVIVIILLVSWELAGRNFNNVRLLTSYPSLTINYLIDNFDSLMYATYLTFIESFIGLGIATIFSFTLMLICFRFEGVLDFLMPIMATSQMVPLIVLAPFFIILFGIGIGSKIAMSALMCFFPIFVNFAQGYKSIDRNYHELMELYDSSLFHRIYYLYFPLSLGNILAGLKISATLSIIGAIVAEFNGAKAGLGKNLFIGALRLEPELMMSSLLLSTCLGLILFNIIGYFGRRLKY